MMVMGSKELLPWPMGMGCQVVQQYIQSVRVMRKLLQELIESVDLESPAANIPVVT